ncbi:type I glyceraldehyde-3-phosphate dehydrogenase [Nitritalea halalkaliphila]|uniref:type I glyceraldehyde-3-phosphate dehydrogenase n=1 Tax=Nitritalea halalkaliphila TaxID=590849 RepID=UPI00031026D3|nr:type I glyceraldehyde-3-phosphate dehydrogenase [Nitritalea halalkaliphila]
MNQRTLKIGVNGCGRIGRLIIKLLARDPRVQLVAVNDLTDVHTLAHLLKYDSIHGAYTGQIAVEGEHLLLEGQPVRVFTEKEPERIPWGDYEVDIVLESTGKFTQYALAEGHLKAGAKRVILTAPPKDDMPMVVLGVNDHVLETNPKIISNASCTTNCLAPMVAVLDEAFGIEKGFVSTVHSYTNDQNLHDAPHRDLRRARAAAYSIIPTTTHAAMAMELVLPHLKGKIEASAMRVPVPNGSLTDLIVQVQRPTSTEEVNALFQAAASGPYAGIISYITEPLVSIDIIGNPHSCLFDAGLTSVKGDLIKLVGWYDNEAGYSHRLLDLVHALGKRL